MTTIGLQFNQSIHYSVFMYNNDNCGFILTVRRRPIGPQVCFELYWEPVSSLAASSNYM